MNQNVLARPRLRRPRRARGFTLIELMIAMVAGLTVALAAFALARNATSFFQYEARISATQLSASLGMTRLTTDLQHAGFLSSPNVVKDPKRCPIGSVVGPWAAAPALQTLAAVQIIQAGSVSGHPGQLTQSIANGFNPDSIIIAGSFDTTEQFPVCNFSNGAQGIDVKLVAYCTPGDHCGAQNCTPGTTASGAMARTVQASLTGGESLNDIFYPVAPSPAATGRYLRIVDAKGNTEYGLITGITITPPNYSATNPPTSVVVHTSSTVAPQVIGGGSYCGITIGDAKSTVFANPVSLIKYDLRSLQGDLTYGPIVAPISATASGDTGRTELVRVELDQNGAELPGRLELISEYAVDLMFGVSVVNLGTQPVVTRYPIAQPPTGTIYTTYGASVAAGGTPELIRAVQVRFATRARAPDRTTEILPAPGYGLDGRRYRFLVDPTLPDPQYARVRTLYSEVTLVNLTNVTW
jgi:prepilin-type N-terminal cleavage/methylation domain-containing protein